MIIFVHSPAWFKICTKCNTVYVLILKFLPFFFMISFCFLLSSVFLCITHFSLFCVGFSAVDSYSRDFASQTHLKKSILYAQCKKFYCHRNAWQNVLLDTKYFKLYRATELNFAIIIICFFFRDCVHTVCEYFARKFKRSLIHWTFALWTYNCWGTDNYREHYYHIQHSQILNNSKQKKKIIINKTHSNNTVHRSQTL